MPTGWPASSTSHASPARAELECCALAWLTAWTLAYSPGVVASLPQAAQKWKSKRLFCRETTKHQFILLGCAYMAMGLCYAYSAEPVRFLATFLAGPPLSLFVQLGHSAVHRAAAVHHCGWLQPHSELIWPHQHSLLPLLSHNELLCLDPLTVETYIFESGRSSQHVGFK